jgi:RNA polymerase sigma-70 factor (ECF subfamily)
MRFETTHWSVVQAAGSDASTEARAALTTLCETYWTPLYWFARRQSHTPDEAQDLTQAFLTEFIEKYRVRAANPERGRFRSFLLASFKHFILNDAQARRAEKRGGGVSPLSLEFDTAEGRYSLEPLDARTPEAIFDRQWAMTVLDLGLRRLAREAAEKGRGLEFEFLRPSLLGESGEGGYAVIARGLGITEGAVKVAVHRLRRRFREMVREEIAQTVATEAEINEEMKSLLAALRR